MICFPKSRPGRWALAIEEKPERPRSNLASMGIYIFNWKTLRQALLANAHLPGLDFGKHIIRMIHNDGVPDHSILTDHHTAANHRVIYLSVNIRTIAVMPVPMEEAKRFGIMITDEERRITDFEEKPERPRSNLASMGIYIFNWKTLSKYPNLLL